MIHTLEVGFQKSKKHQCKRISVNVKGKLNKIFSVKGIM